MKLLMSLDKEQPVGTFAPFFYNFLNCLFTAIRGKKCSFPANKIGNRLASLDLPKTGKDFVTRHNTFPHPFVTPLNVLKTTKILIAVRTETV